MVAVAPNVVNDSLTQDVSTKNELSLKQQKRVEEQTAREAKKLAKRQEKSLQKERKAAEKERKEQERLRKMEELRLEKEGKTPKELEEEQRRVEEQELFQREFGIVDDESSSSKSTAHGHVKKSAFDSNRLGGTHMA